MTTGCSFRRTSRGRCASLQTPMGRPMSLHTTPIVRDASVGLRAESIGDEVVAGAPVVGAIHYKHHRIVTKEIRVALRQLRGDRLLIPGAKGDVQMARIVENQRFGLQRRPFTMLRLVLDEAGDGDGGLPLVRAGLRTKAYTPGMTRRDFVTMASAGAMSGVALARGLARAGQVRPSTANLQQYGNGTIPPGIRSRTV